MDPGQGASEDPVGEDVFNSWFGRVELEEVGPSQVHLSVATRFLKSWINAHYSERLLKLWKAERKAIARIEISVRGAVRTKAVLRPQPTEAAQAAPVKEPPGGADPLPARENGGGKGGAQRLAGRSQIQL